MKHFGWIAVLVLIWSGPAYAQVPELETVQDFVAECTSKKIYNVYCLGLVNGVAGVLVFIGSFTDPVRKTIGMCIPSFTSNAQMRQIVLNWAKNNPKYWQQKVEIGVILALSKAFPCK